VGLIREAESEGIECIQMLGIKSSGGPWRAEFLDQLSKYQLSRDIGFSDFVHRPDFS
jgi:hypothetical protein